MASATNPKYMLLAHLGIFDMSYYDKICKCLYSRINTSKMNMFVLGHIVYKFNLTTVEQNYTKR